MSKRKMKDSGVEWLGDVPEEWRKMRVRSFLRNVSEKNHPEAEVLSLYRELGVVPKNSRDDNHNVTGEDTSQYKFVQRGDLVINKMKAWQGSLAVSDYEGIVSPAYYVCRFHGEKVSSRFVHYLLRNVRYAQEFERLSTGMRVGQWDLGIDDFLRIPLFLPPLLEQRKIAAYLDGRCAKIDEMILDAKKTIEEYKAWKNSEIFEMVTGLRSGLPMLSSGEVWMPQIPGAWRFVRGKTFLRLLKRPIRPDDEIVTCFRDGEVTLRKNRREDGFTVALKECGYQGVEPGDLVVHGMDGFAGSIGVCDSRGKASPVLNVMDSDENKFFIVYYLKALSIKDVFMGLSTGIRVRSCDLRWNKLAELRYLIPARREQDEIVLKLDKKCAVIDRVISAKESLIADLESYKKSLIFECVTGKMEVA